MTISNALVEFVAEQGVRFEREVHLGEVHYYVVGDTHNGKPSVWFPMGALLAGVQFGYSDYGTPLGACKWSDAKKEFVYISTTAASRYLYNRPYFTEDGVLHGSRVVKSLKPFLEEKFREAGLLVADDAETAEVNSND